MTTAADLMTAAVPQAPPNASVADTMEALRSRSWDEVGHVYLLDERSQLVGQVPIERLLAAALDTRLDSVRGNPPLIVRADDNAETVALLAVEQHDADVAVLDEPGRFMGAIPIGRLLALLHEEHVDDILRMGGLAAFHPAPPEVGGIARIVRARVPWLLIGLAGGFLAGGIASLFEGSLKDNITLAFFLPLVVYMADAVGTQTETILVRALAYGRVSLGAQLLREGTVGLLIGGIVGLSAGACLLAWGGARSVALTLAVTLTLTAMIATFVASLLPIGLSRMGVDPALASGPVATVVQDILSVAVYLGIAALIL
ncbi:MAG TPA: magnesium transporter [Nitrospiraceae bacterium]|nr:magnesium transporter [Nitrospiraceae bacterium]